MRSDADSKAASDRSGTPIRISAAPAVDRGMAIERIFDPAGFLSELGRLHDVCIDALQFDTDNETLTLNFDDIHAASEHQDRRPCALIFRGVGSLLLDVETSEGIRIGKAAIVADGSSLRLEVDLNLGGGTTTQGRRSIVVSFESMLVSDIETP